MDGRIREERRSSAYIKSAVEDSNLWGGGNRCTASWRQNCSYGTRPHYWDWSDGGNWTQRAERIESRNLFCSGNLGAKRDKCKTTHATNVVLIDFAVGLRDQSKPFLEREIVERYEFTT